MSSHRHLPLKAFAGLLLLLAACQDGPPPVTEDISLTSPTAVIQEGRRGFVDTLGATVVSPRFARGSNFVQGFARVRLGEKQGLIRADGEYAIPPEHAYVGYVADGRAVFQAEAGGRFGYLDTAGGVVIEAKFPFADDFSEGLAAVLVAGDTAGALGYIDRDGTLRIPPRFIAAGPFSESLAAAAEQAGQFGYIGRDGEWAIRPRFTAAGDFADQRAAVSEGDGCGYIDPAGSVQVPLQFETCGDFHEGLAAVRENGRIGWMTPVGEWAIPPRFSHGGIFSFGLAAAAVSDDDGNVRWGFVDPSGTWVVPARYDGVDAFASALARVYMDDGDRMALVDRTGRVVYGPVATGGVPLMTSRRSPDPDDS